MSPPPTVLRKAETEGEKYIYFWQQNQLLPLLSAVRQTCWKRWLSIVILVHWDQLWLLMTSSLLKSGGKLLLWLMSGGHVQTQLKLGAGTKKQKLQARKVSGWVRVRISPFSRLPFGRKLYWKRELFFSNDNTRFWNEAQQVEASSTDFKRYCIFICWNVFQCWQLTSPSGKGTCSAVVHSLPISLLKTLARYFGGCVL